VLRRRPEAYHEVLRELAARAANDAALREASARQAEDAGLDGTDAGADREPSPAVRDPGAPVSIHDIVSAKEERLAERLVYDDHERRLGLVRFLVPSIAPEEAASGTAPDLGDFVDGAFRVERLEPGLLVVVRDGHVRSESGQPAAVRFEKAIRISGERRAPTLDVELLVENRSGETIEARIGLELPTMLLGGGGNPSAWWDVGGRRTGHDVSGRAAGISAIGQGNDHVGISVATAVEPAADAWWSPIETVSNSESGFERAYQGSSLLLSWVRRLASGERFTASVHNRVTVAADRAAEERAGH
jgi:alpha-amylase